MFDALDQPVIFLIVMVVLVLAVAHLANMLAKMAGWTGAASFFSLP